VLVFPLSQIPKIVGAVQKKKKLGLRPMETLPIVGRTMILSASTQSRRTDIHQVNLKLEGTSDRN